MKNQYFADINDYRKYGLIRALIAPGALSVGVCWMLTRDDQRPDGQFRDYLEFPARWRRFDPELYDALAYCQSSPAGPSIAQAESYGLIQNARYVTDTLGDRLSERSDYFARSLRQLRGVDLIFFDPDNGIEVSSVRKGSKNSSKYLYWSEIEEAYRTGASLLIYQHFPRRARSTFIELIAQRLREVTGAKHVESYRTAHVVFLLAAQSAHAASLTEGAYCLGRVWGDQVDIKRVPPCAP